MNTAEFFSRKPASLPASRLLTREVELHLLGADVHARFALLELREREVADDVVLEAEQLGDALFDPRLYNSKLNLMRV